MANAGAPVDSLHLAIPGDQLYASWSPDGQYLVYQSNANGNWDIYLYSLKTGETNQLTNNQTDEQHPVWVPGKNAVVFERGEGHQTRLYLLNLDNHREKQLINRKIAGRQASFTPSRHLVAFSGWDAISESWQLFTYDFIYDNLNQLTHENGEVSFPEFGPKGKKIAYLVHFDGESPALAMCNWYGDGKHLYQGLAPGKLSWGKSGWRFYGVKRDAIGNWSVCSWRNDGTAKACVYSAKYEICGPAFSPADSSWAISKRSIAGNFDLWIFVPTHSP